MLKKIVLLVAVMAGASSVSFTVDTSSDDTAAAQLLQNSNPVPLSGPAVVDPIKPVVDPQPKASWTESVKNGATSAVNGTVKFAKKAFVVKGAKGRTAVKSAANLALLVATAEAARKVYAAAKSADVKAAVGFKAKAVAFGKGLNLSPRQSKVLYGALVAAALGHTANKFVPETKYF